MSRNRTQSKWMFMQVMLGSAVIAAFLIYYFLVHVPARRTYLIERNCRLLAGMSDQIKDRIRHVNTALTNAATKAFRPGPASETNGAANRVMQVLAQVVPQLDIVSPPQVVTNSTPTIQGLPLITFQVTSDLDHAWLQFNYTNRTTTTSVTFSVRTELRRLIEPALGPHEFDHVLLAQSDGEVLCQLAERELRIHRLPLQETQKAQKDDLKEPGAAGPPALRFHQMTGLYQLHLLETDYQLFTQPLHVGLPTLADQSPVRWVVCGLVGAKSFRSQVWSLPKSVIVYTVSLGLFLVLSWPFLNLQFARPKDGITPAEAFGVAAASVLGCASLTLLLLDLNAYPGLEHDADSQLEELAGDIERNLNAELKAVNEQLNRFTGHAASEKHYEGSSSYENRTLLLSSDTLNDTNAYPYLTMAWWADAGGQQLFKWAIASNTTPAIRVADRGYVRTILDERAWPATDTISNGFCVEPIVSRTRGENVTMFSIAVSAPPGAAVAAMELRPLSLFHPVLPAGHGFCIVENGGRVLFHSDERRNLQENFLTECANDPRLIAAIEGRVASHFDVRYFRRLHHLYVTPLRGLPWSLVTFHDEDALGTVNLQVLAASLILIGVYAVLLLTVVGVTCAIDRGRRWDWLWPAPRRSSAHIAAGLVALACLAMLAATQCLDCTLEWRLGAAFALPLLGFLVVWLLLTGRCPGGDKPATKFSAAARRLNHRVIHVTSLGLLLLLVAAGPAIASFTIAMKLETRLLLKGSQLRLAKDHEIREERLRQEWRDLPGGSNWFALRLTNSWDVYERFFFDTRTSRELVKPTNAPGPTFFESAWPNLRPSFARQDLGNQGRLWNTDDDSWHWREGTNRVFYMRPTTERSNGLGWKIVSRDVALPTPEWWWYLIAAACLAVPFVLVRFIGRKVFLLDVCEPATPPAVDPSLVAEDKPGGPVPSPADPFTALERSHLHLLDLRKTKPNDRPASPELRELLDDADAVLVVLHPDPRKFAANPPEWCRRLIQTPSRALVVIKPTRTEPNVASAAEDLLESVAQQLTAAHAKHWQECSSAEKLLLYHAARSGLVDSHQPELRALLHKGLLRRDPRLRLLNGSFRRFVLTHANPDELAAPQADERTALWQKTKGALSIVVIGVAMFLFLTQRETWNLIIGLIPAFIAGLATLSKVPGLFQKQKAPD